MALFLKQSTAVDIKVGPFLDSADGNTIENTLTITQPDIRLAKNGGAFAQKNAAQTLSHEENGWYEVSLDTTDTNTLGILTLVIHESGALQVWEKYMVVPANVYDSLVGGSDVLDVSVTQWLGQAAAAVTNNGVPEVDITHIGGVAVSTTTAQLGVNVVQISTDATAADNLETAFDGGAYNVGGGSIVAASVTGAVGSVTGAVGSVTGNVGGNVTGSVGSLATQAKADVNAEVDDVIHTDTRAELGTVPAANASYGAKLNYLFMKARNKVTQSATQQIVYADDGSTPVGTSSVSDNGVTLTRGEDA